MNINFTQFPILNSKRLSLRKLSFKDDNEIYFLRSDKLLNKYLDRPIAVCLKDAIDFIKKIFNGIENNEWFYWAVTFKNEQKLIGTICLWNINCAENKAEVGYELLPDFQGKGIAQEALSAVIDFGFDVIELQTIEAYTHKENLQSIKLLEKFNFKRNLIAELKINLTIDSPDTIIYSLRKPN